VIGFIDMMRGRGFRVEPICEVLGEYGIKIAARTYRAAKARLACARDIDDAQVINQMVALRTTRDMRGNLPRERFYGRRKMRALLARRGVHASISRVGRLMGLAGMKGLVRGRRVVTTHKSAVGAGDLLRRDFTADGPDRVWVTDLTYVRTSSGWVYVTFITDAYARRIIACAGACEMTERLVSDTLTIAIGTRAKQGHRIKPGLIAHHDHGSQYTAIHYTQQLEMAGIKVSYGTVGDSYDNALAEAVNGTYKAECVGPDGPFANLTAVMDATLAWVNWYNQDRLHEYLDYRTPAEVEAEYYGRPREPLEPPRSTK